VNSDLYKSVPLNLFEYSEILNFLVSIKPDLILNCSGLTNVELCEVETEKALYLHKIFPERIAKFTKENSIRNIHISTDHLWDGSHSFYKEEDKTSPLNVYGKTKAEGELAVLEANPNSIVVRTNFFDHGSEWRKSFSDWAIFMLKNKSIFSGFDDVYYTPISVPYLLQFMYAVLEKEFSGIIHIAGSERISKYEFIFKLAKILNLDSSNLKKESYLEKSKTVQRPKDMSLNTTKLSSLISKEIPDAESSIRSIF